MNTTKKAKPLFARVLAVILALALLIPGLAPQPAQAEGGDTAPIAQPRAAGGDNWDLDLPGNDPNFWPMREQDKINNTGGAAVKSLRISSLSYVNNYINDKGERVYEMEWKTYWAATSAGFKVLELKLDSLIDDTNMKSLQYKNSNGVWKDMKKLQESAGFSPNIYWLDRNDCFSTALVTNQPFRVPIRLTFKAEVTPETFGNTDLLVQMRTADVDPNRVNNARKYFAKADTRRQVTYNDYTIGTVLPVNDLTQKEEVVYNAAATTDYFRESNLRAVYIPSTDVVRLMYGYNNESILLGLNKGMPPVYEVAVDPRLVSVLDDKREMSVYVTDHNDIIVDANDTWHIPLSYLEAKDNKPENVLRVVGTGFVGDRAQGAFVGPDEGRDSYLHTTVTTNPCYTVVEFPVDRTKALNLFEKQEIGGQEIQEIFTEMNFTAAFYANGQDAQLRVFDVTVSEEMVVPEGGIAKLDFNVKPKDKIKNVYLNYGPRNSSRVGEESGWYRYHQWKNLDGATLQPGDKITIYIADDSKSLVAPNAKLTIGGKTFTIPVDTTNQGTVMNPVMDGSFAMASVGLERTFYVPKIDDVYDTDAKITGSTKQDGVTVDVATPGLDGYLTTLSVPADNGTFVYEVAPGAGILKKDMRVSARATMGSKFPTNLVDEKVKSRVTFDLNQPEGLAEGAGITFQPYADYEGDALPDFADKKDEAGRLRVVAPENEKYRDEDGYAPNGLNYKADNRMPANPTLEGYIFKGWNTQKDGNAYNFDGNYEITQSMTVYAQWAKGYTVVLHDVKGADGDGTKRLKAEENAKLPVEVDAEYGKDVAEKQFVSWNTESVQEQRVPDTDVSSSTDYAAIASKVVNGELHLYPRYTSVPTYTMKFMESGEHLGTKTPMAFTGNTAEVDEAYILEFIGKKVQQVTPLGDEVTYADVDEIDWAATADANANNLLVAVDAAEKKITFTNGGESNLSLAVVVLKPKEFTIKYKEVINGIVGDFIDAVEPVVNPKTYTYRTPQFKLKPIQKDGFKFLGWRPTLEQEQENPGADQAFRTIMVPFGKVENKTYEAGYEKIYKITYKLDGGTFAVDANYPLDFTMSDQITIDQEPTKEGYNFKGWRIDNGKAVIKPVIIENRTKDITLTAVWEGKFTADAVSSPTTHSVPGNGKEGDAKTYTSIPLPTGAVAGDEVTVRYPVKENDKIIYLEETHVFTAEDREKGKAELELPNGDKIPSNGDVVFTYAHGDGTAAFKKDPNIPYSANPQALWESYQKAYAKAFPGKTVDNSNYQAPLPGEPQGGPKFVESFKKVYETIIQHKTKGDRIEAPNNMTQLEIDRLRVELDKYLKTPQPEAYAVKHEEHVDVIVKAGDGPEEGTDTLKPGDIIIIEYDDGSGVTKTKEVTVGEPDTDVDYENGEAKVHLKDVAKDDITIIGVTVKEKVAEEDGIVTYKEPSDEVNIVVTDRSATPTVVLGDESETATPLIVTPGNPEGFKNGDKITVKGPGPDQTKTVTIGTDAEVNVDGTVTISIEPALENGKSVQVTVQETDKAESEPAVTIKKKDLSEGLAVDPVQEGDTTVAITPPINAEAGDTVAITIPGEPDATTVELVKGTDGKWHGGGGKSYEPDAETGKINVAVSAVPYKPAGDNTITVKATDVFGNKADKETDITQKPTSATPTQPKQQGDKITSTVDPSGLSEDTKVYLTDSDGKKLAEGTREGENITFTPISEELNGKEVFVTVEEPGKKPTTSNESLVVDTVKPAEPSATAKEGEPNVLVKEPTDDTTSIKVDLGDGTTVTATKEGDSWKVGDTPVDKDENGNLVIPLPDGKTVPGEGNITVTAEDPAGNQTSTDVTPETIPTPDAPSRVVSRQATDSEFSVRGNAPAGSEVVIKVEDEGVDKYVTEDGSLTKYIDEAKKIPVGDNGKFNERVKFIKKDGKVKGEMPFGLVTLKDGKESVKTTKDMRDRDLKTPKTKLSKITLDQVSSGDKSIRGSAENVPFVRIVIEQDGAENLTETVDASSGTYEFTLPEGHTPMQSGTRLTVDGVDNSRQPLTTAISFQVL